MIDGARDRHTFMFADLAGFTAPTEAHGDERAADVALEFCDGSERLLGADAEDLRMLGDACLLRVGSAADAVALGLAITTELAARHGFPDVRVGMNTGLAVRRGPEWFGAAINIAARVAALAGPDQVLLTEATRTDATRVDTVQLAGVEFADRGDHALRHVTAPVHIHQARHPASETQHGRWVIDPVCRMRLQRERAVASRRGGGDAVYFCSPACAATFGEAPTATPDRRPPPGDAKPSGPSR